MRKDNCSCCAQPTRDPSSEQNAPLRFRVLSQKFFTHPSVDELAKGFNSQFNLLSAPSDS